MAQRILKNNTASPVSISDTGGTVPASGQLVINPVDYGVYEGSSDVIGYIGDSTLTVNDGTFDLSINEGTRLIQGGFSRPISDGDDPTIKAKVTDSTGTTEYNKRLYTEDVVAGLDGATFRRANTRLRPDGRVGLCTDSIPVISTNFIYEDMNASTGGVARGTTINTSFVTIYSHSGAGLLWGVNVSVQNRTSDWYIRIIIDGNDMLIGTGGMIFTDIYDNRVYCLEFSGATNNQGLPFAGLAMLNGAQGNLRWSGPNGYPVGFTSSVVVQLRKGSGSNDFFAGLVARS